MQRLGCIFDPDEISQAFHKLLSGPWYDLVSSQACPITPSLDLFAPGCFKKSLQNAAMRGFLRIAGNKNIFDLTDISHLT